MSKTDRRQTATRGGVQVAHVSSCGDFASMAASNPPLARWHARCQILAAQFRALRRFLMAGNQSGSGAKGQSDQRSGSGSQSGKSDSSGRQQDQSGKSSQQGSQEKGSSQSGGNKSR
jgi:hypothetical protein